MTPEQQNEFQKVLQEILSRPEKLIEYSDVEWDAVMGDYHQRVGIAYSAFLAGIKFARATSKTVLTSDDLLERLLTEFNYWKDSDDEFCRGATLAIANVIAQATIQLPTAWQLEKEKNMNKRLVISDLDGTIALVDHRRHLVTGEKKDWRKFFAECINDEPNYAVIKTLKILQTAGYKIVIFSGRSDEVKPETLHWLRKFNVPFDDILMRKDGDYTPDEELKKQWLSSINKDEIFVIFDDRQKVVDMWREEGLVVFQVAPGDF